MENTTLTPPAQHKKATPYDQRLFDALRAVRKQIADEQKKEAYMVFSNRTLEEMATYIPQSTQQFLRIFGVSDTKFDAYGEQFLKTLRTYANANNVQERTVPSKKDRILLAAKDPHSTYAKTRELVEKGVSLQDIARERNMQPGTVVAHIEVLLAADPLLDIAYLRPDPETFGEIADAFFTVSPKKYLTPVFKALGEKHSFDTIRLVRLFLTK